MTLLAKFLSEPACVCSMVSPKRLLQVSGLHNLQQDAGKDVLGDAEGRFGLAKFDLHKQARIRSWVAASSSFCTAQMAAI